MQNNKGKEHLKGEIQVILGPMFSGKSTELLRRIKRYTVANCTCALISYLGDDRYNVTPETFVIDLNNTVEPFEQKSQQAKVAVAGKSVDECLNSGTCSGSINSSSGHIITHEKIAVKSHGEQTLEGFWRKFNRSFEHIDVIGIDEGQFFPDVCKYAEKWANMNKIVIVAALDATFQKKGFNDILNLIPLAEKITKLTAVCHFCAKDASFSLRIGPSKEIEVIGGEDAYWAVCRSCYAAHHHQ